MVNRVGKTLYHGVIRALYGVVECLTVLLSLGTVPRTKS